MHLDCLAYIEQLLSGAKELFEVRHANRMHCQYSVATILWPGLCCESEKDFIAIHAVRIDQAIRWWIAATSQGHVYALDNLTTSGIGLRLSVLEKHLAF